MTCKGQAHRSPERGPRPCAQCGTVFAVKPKNKASQRFCSVACRTLGTRTFPRETRACAWCSAGFVTQAHKPKQKYCSRACAAAAVAKERMPVLREASRKAYVARLREKLKDMSKGEAYRTGYSRGYCAGLRRGREQG